MEKIDYKKQLKHLYAPNAKQVVELDVPTMNFLSIDGEGEPASQSYSQAVEALYMVSYALKFMAKKGELAIDYGVMPLEGLWWADDMENFSVDNKGDWKWKMMIMQPEIITSQMIETAISDVGTKKNPTALSLMKFEAYEEGKCAQILHIGPFSEEGPTVEKVHQYIDEKSQRRGRHHEIYLSDIRRAAPEKWKTIIRQPMD